MATSFARTVIVYILIVIAVRIMGKRQISELQASELVVTLLISDLAAIPLQDNSQPLTSGLIPIMVLISLEVIVSVLMMKSNKIRRTICGKPILVVNNGEIQEKELHELRMSKADLMEALRQKDIFELKNIKFALVETNGLISVMQQNEMSNTSTDIHS